VFLRLPTVGFSGVGAFKGTIVPMEVFPAFSRSTVGILLILPTIFKGYLRGFGLHQVVQLATRSFEGGMSKRGSTSMAYQDNDRITNPDDSYDREWGAGSAVTVIVAVLIMVGIVAYGGTGAATNTDTGVSSSISQPTTTGT
jgi:hypothetical protein